MSGLRITPLRDASFAFGLLPRFICRWVKGPLWRLDEDYTFTLAVPRCMATCQARTYTIPAGYEFDKASIPPVFWGPPLNYTPDGLGVLPALEHDFLCDLLSGGSDWLRIKLVELPEAPPAWMVHRHFYLRLLQAGVRPSKAAAMGRAVAWFGPQGKAWPWLKVTLILANIFIFYRYLLP